MTEKYSIRTRSHILHLLGDELIGDDRLAVFELVKNGYDADANEVIVLLNLEEKKPNIIVEDNGCGMSLSDVTEKWLELGTGSRREQLDLKSKKYHRLPLGEKGIGRLATFKLGDEVTLYTRFQGCPEIKVHVNWKDLVASDRYIENLKVDVVELETPKYFKGKAVGTRVEIGELKTKNWSRKDIRALYRLVTSLSSPFDTPEKFSVLFEAPGRENEYEDMLKPEDFLEQAIWKYTFAISESDENKDIPGKNFSWSYEFNPPHWKGVNRNTCSQTSDQLKLIPVEGESKKKVASDSILLKEDDLEGIGPIVGTIYGYYRRPEVLKQSGNQTQLKTWLDDQTGVKVYRDGIRVFNYGEPQDDWLELNAKRVNTPTERLGTKSVVSTINLKLEHSRKLKEQTNREGFEQNLEFYRFRRAVASVFEHFIMLHKDDREKIDDFIKGRNPGEEKIKVHDAVSDLKKKLKGHPEFESMKKDLDSIEVQFDEIRDVMVGAGIAGLNLAVVFHEVERGVDALAAAVDGTTDIKTLRKSIEHVQKLLHTFSPLLKKNPAKNIFVSDIVKAALDMRVFRFKYHKVVTSSPILTKEELDFKIKVPANLITGALGNLLDNSIYWTRFRQERDGTNNPPAILVKTHHDAEEQSGFIAVIDNGPGFSSVTKEKASRPFYTTRPEGMGLGLYFASLVMEQCGGILTIHDASELRDEIDIPSAYDGAAVVLRFGVNI